MSKPRMCGAFAPYTPNNKRDSRYRQKATKVDTIPGRCANCGHWSRNEVGSKDWGVCLRLYGVGLHKHEDGFCDRWREV